MKYFKKIIKSNDIKCFQNHFQVYYKYRKTIYFSKKKFSRVLKSKDAYAYQQLMLFLNLRIVRTRFVTNRNSVGFACKMAQTISFVERGYERLGFGHQAMGFSWCSCMVKLSSPLESSSWRWAGRLWFLAIFPASCLVQLLFYYIVRLG